MFLSHTIYKSKTQTARTSVTLLPERRERGKGRPHCIFFSFLFFFLFSFFLVNRKTWPYRSPSNSKQRPPPPQPSVRQTPRVVQQHFFIQLKTWHETMRWEGGSWGEREEREREPALCACVRACVHACACVRACVCARMCVYVCVRASLCVRACVSASTRTLRLYPFATSNDESTVVQ